MADERGKTARCTAVSLHHVAFHEDLGACKREGTSESGIKRAHEQNVPLVLNPAYLIMPKAVGAGTGGQRVAGEVPVTGVRGDVQVTSEESCGNRPARGTRELIDEFSRRGQSASDQREREPPNWSAG